MIDKLYESIHKVCKVSKKEMFSKSRKRRIVKAKIVGMKILYFYPQIFGSKTLTEIGNCFNYDDHASVWRHMSKVKHNDDEKELEQLLKLLKPKNAKEMMPKESSSFINKHTEEYWRKLWLILTSNTTTQKRQQEIKEQFETYLFKIKQDEK